ncbi:MAG: hypothetical protein AAB691_01975 [Patescibacteria group bacterium]
MKIFKSWTFAWWEVSLIKLCLMSLGILLGLYFYDYLIDLLSLWWAVFVVTALYFIIRFFREG